MCQWGKHYSLSMWNSAWVTRLHIKPIQYYLFLFPVLLLWDGREKTAESMICWARCLEYRVVNKGSYLKQGRSWQHRAEVLLWAPHSDRHSLTHTNVPTALHTHSKHWKYSGRHIIKTYQEWEMLDSNHPDIQVCKTVALNWLSHFTWISSKYWTSS